MTQPSQPTNALLVTAGAAAPDRLLIFLLLALELCLISGLIFLFEIESDRYFLPVWCVALGGFAVHYWLPAPLRMPFFVVLSLAAILLVLGVESGLWLIAIGIALIAICHLPVSFRVQMMLLGSAGVLLVTLRTRLPMPFWPVLGSMFMFRLILYIYERRGSSEPVSLPRTLAYFFLLPNVCFLLFPVVDYRTFRNSWFSESEHAIYQRGVHWLVQGLLHLLLYRYIKRHLVPEPYELIDLQHIVLFMATNYALYLKVSGQFHVITGMLHLFGFHLPRTHHLYFLASSFTDIWRRINIYWKDFMTRVFFFPSFHSARLRGASLQSAIVIGVFCVFVMTWLLHSWQTFWLLGRFPVTVNDAALWLGAGVCVAVNSLWETRQRRGRQRPRWVAGFIHSAKVVGMFSLVSLFWACWTQPGFLVSLGESFRTEGSLAGFSLVGGWLGGAVVLGTGLFLLRERWIGSSQPIQLSFHDSVRLHIAGLALACLLGSGWFSRGLDPDAARALAEFRSGETGGEAEQRLQNYYEDLNAAAIQAGPLMRSISPRTEAVRQRGQGFQKVSRAADPYQDVELIPGLETDLDGVPFSVNQFGMRDRSTVTLEKPGGVQRIAILGSSIVMGYGVSDTDVFTRVFEERLNTRFDHLAQFEVLNFGVGKQWATHRLVRFQRLVRRFHPDALYYIAHQDEFKELAVHPAKLLDEGLELPSAAMSQVVKQAGIKDDMPWGEIQSRLRRYETQMLQAVYTTIVDECHILDATPVWIYVPVPDAGASAVGERLRPIAAKAGFVTADLSDWPTGHDPVDLFLPGDTEHPNATGHELIAEALVRMFEVHPATRP